jgi:hypothetical protein
VEFREVVGAESELQFDQVPVFDDEVGFPSRDSVLGDGGYVGDAFAQPSVQVLLVISFEPVRSGRFPCLEHAQHEASVGFEERGMIDESVHEDLDYRLSCKSGGSGKNAFWVRAARPKGICALATFDGVLLPALAGKFFEKIFVPAAILVELRGIAL